MVILCLLEVVYSNFAPPFDYLVRLSVVAVLVWRWWKSDINVKSDFVQTDAPSASAEHHERFGFKSVPMIQQLTWFKCPSVRRADMCGANIWNERRSLRMKAKLWSLSSCDKLQQVSLLYIVKEREHCHNNTYIPEVWMMMTSLRSYHVYDNQHKSGCLT